MSRGGARPSDPFAGVAAVAVAAVDDCADDAASPAAAFSSDILPNHQAQSSSLLQGLVLKMR
jgi:hypothetical protein